MCHLVRLTLPEPPPGLVWIVRDVVDRLAFLRVGLEVDAPVEDRDSLRELKDADVVLRVAVEGIEGVEGVEELE
jgi:hypothetical protein